MIRPSLIFTRRFRVMDEGEKQLARLKSAILNMRRAKIAGRVKPHKPLMLLVVLDLFDIGVLRENRVPYSEELTERFSDYFQTIAEEGDWCQPAPPFFHLRSDGFWKHKPISGRETQYAGIKTSGGGSKRIKENIDYAYFDDNTFSVIRDPIRRRHLRAFILKTCFTPAEQRAVRKAMPISP